MTRKNSKLILEEIYSTAQGVKKINDQISKIRLFITIRMSIALGEHISY